MNILTFDIEEWFHLLDEESTKSETAWNGFESRIHRNVDRILEMLQETNIKATFFCLGWVAGRYPEVIKKISGLGYEVATHSNMHQLAYEQSKGEFTDDLTASIDIIENLIGKKVVSYRAPGFSLTEQNKWVFEILAQNGIENDSSVFPAGRAHGGFASFGDSRPCIVEVNGHRIKEFPINTYRFASKDIIFSGGGYFRLFPYALVRYLMNRSPYVMTYFHPRDFDSGQPMITGLSTIRKFKSYYGLSSAFEKFKRLASDFDFVDLNTAVKSTNWSTSKIIKI